MDWLKTAVTVPLFAVAIIATIIFVIAVGIYIPHRLHGGAPAPLLSSVFVLWSLTAVVPAIAIAAIWRVNPFKKLKSSAPLRHVGTAVLLFLVVIGFDVNCGPRSLRAAFRRETIAGTQAEQLAKTYVTAHLDWPAGSTTNVLWCGTFQLAWNEACRIFGTNIQLDGASPTVAALNRHEFTRDSLDADSYVAMAGFVRSNIHEQIEAKMQKFPGAFKHPLLPEKRMAPGPNDFIAYAALFKNLSFETPFSRIDDPFEFQGAQVRAFGIGPKAQTESNLYSQVLIHDYVSATNFLIELRTTTPGDRLLLAKIPPERTLADSVAAVQRRVRPSQADHAVENDVLLVPCLGFDVTRNYTEIAGQRVVSPTSLGTDMYLLSAMQRTRFEMNEKGVELKSEAHASFGCAKEAAPERQHIMIFDRPFLIILERADAKMPYFALWVANPELFIRW